MSSSQLAESSFVKINADIKTVSDSTNFVPVAVGIVEDRSFSDFAP